MQCQPYGHAIPKENRQRIFEPFFAAKAEKGPRSDALMRSPSVGFVPEGGLNRGLGAWRHRQSLPGALPQPQFIQLHWLAVSIFRIRMA
jgi:hypothetical protein